jgi:hypothetical protein
MNASKLTLSIAVAALASNISAEVVTKSFTGTGTIDSVDVEAAVSTTVNVFPAGTDVDEAKESEAKPYPVAAQWQFSWNTDEPNAVDFKVDLDVGEYFTVTDAGTMGGVSIQTFNGVVYHIGGTAQWDASTRTLSYEVPLKKRSDGRASTITQKSDPTCDGATIACKAFLNTTPELEGVAINLVFDESLESFTASMSATQYEGAMFTKNQTDMNMSARGELNVQE